MEHIHVAYINDKYYREKLFNLIIILIIATWELSFFYYFHIRSISENVDFHFSCKKTIPLMTFISMLCKPMPKQMKVIK